ncbi:5'-3' exonuclease [Siminovitchia terrae]|uniref:5'-3' exonuclease n=1 Tax=Siminovitchia terrae TaxID=1914933 RepID=A0ABQ4KY33_SIMTE|nr:5'-3' exonuclease H3TH domain-containing protein [Siminovitchia terrae]GIN96582.1 5'-3' exonuclease [Siminovitchia terrae]
MDNKKLLLVDGMALLFRAFFATSVRKQFMINSKGIPTNAVQGFLRHFLSALESSQPSHVAVCWDMGSQTFRNEIFQDYKSNREAPPVELLPQFDLVKEVTSAFSVPNVGLSGYEADDCIGTICEQMKKDIQITVLTGDRDLLQILDDQVHVWILQKGIGNYTKYSRTVFTEKFQLDPKQLVDVKALMGDPSDGYPGVKGIGEKTATKLIQEHGDIESLLENLSTLTPSQRNKIEQDQEMMHLSRELAQIHREVPVTIDLEEAYWSGVPQTAHEMVQEHELNTVRRQLQQLEKELLEDPFAERELSR